MSNKTTITIKATTTICADLGDVPPGLVRDLITKGGDGTTLSGDWSIFDMDSPRGALIDTVLDSVTVE